MAGLAFGDTIVAVPFVSEVVTVDDCSTCCFFFPFDARAGVAVGLRGVGAGATAADVFGEESSPVVTVAFLVLERAVEGVAFLREDFGAGVAVIAAGWAVLSSAASSSLSPSSIGTGKVATSSSGVLASFGFRVLLPSDVAVSAFPSSSSLLESEADDESLDAPATTGVAAGAGTAAAGAFCLEGGAPSSSESSSDDDAEDEEESESESEAARAGTVDGFFLVVGVAADLAFTAVVGVRAKVVLLVAMGVASVGGMSAEFVFVNNDEEPGVEDNWNRFVENGWGRVGDASGMGTSRWKSKNAFAVALVGMVGAADAAGR